MGTTPMTSGNMGEKIRKVTMDDLESSYVLRTHNDKKELQKTLIYLSQTLFQKPDSG